MMSNRARWTVVAAYAAGMAWVESAAVFYLRTLVDRLEPYQPDPLPIGGTLDQVELARELATMVMLATVAVLAGRCWRSRLGWFAVAFGVWDISYYAFLKIMCGWPHSLLDWDVLFLLPLPWWGPVLAPMLIALLMIVWGTLVTGMEERRLRQGWGWPALGLGAVGLALALYVFMADALKVAGQGEEALRRMLPVAFNWPLFGAAWLLMAAPLWPLGREWQRGEGDRHQG
jgi:hypothetical protein